MFVQFPVLLERSFRLCEAKPTGQMLPRQIHPIASRVRFWLRRIFRDRQVIFRSDEGARHTTWGWRGQAVMATVLCAIVLWAVGATMAFGVSVFKLASREQEVRDLEIGYASLIVDLANERGSVAAVTQQLDHHQSLSAHILDRNRALEEDLAERDQLLVTSRADYARVESEWQALARQVELLTGDLEQSITRRETLEAQMSQVSEAVSGLDQQRLGLELERNRLNANIAEQNDRLRAAEAWGETLEKQIDELTTAVEQAYATIGAVADERDSLRAERVELDTALVVSNDRNRVLQDRLNAAQGRSLVLSQDNENLREENAALVGQVERIGKQLAAVREGQTRIFASLRNRNSAFIDGIETGLSMTGLNIEAMIDEMVEQIDEAEGQGQGGPLLPPNDDAIDAQLWDDAMDLISMVGRAASLRTLVSRLPIDRPVVAEHWVSSHFGLRIDPMTKRKSRHEGIDFAGAPGTEILASGAGVVTFAGRNGAYGEMVEIDHGIGLTTRYAHLKKLAIQAGDNVAQGEVIGYMGSTGRSTGTHLHYEVRVDGDPVDPKSFLEAGEHVFEATATAGGN